VQVTGALLVDGELQVNRVRRSEDTFVNVDRRAITRQRWPRNGQSSPPGVNPVKWISLFIEAVCT